MHLSQKLMKQLAGDSKTKAGNPRSLPNAKKKCRSSFTKDLPPPDSGKKKKKKLFEPGNYNGWNPPKKFICKERSQPESVLLVKSHRAGLASKDNTHLFVLTWPVLKLMFACPGLPGLHFVTAFLACVVTAGAGQRAAPRILAAQPLVNQNCMFVSGKPRVSLQNGISSFSGNCKSLSPG